MSAKSNQNCKDSKSCKDTSKQNTQNQSEKDCK